VPTSVSAPVLPLELLIGSLVVVLVGALLLASVLA